MIVYYSGTGNSEYVAKRLAAGLADEAVNAFDYIKSRKAARLHSEKPWIFVAPTYAWRMARIFEKFLLASHFTGSDEAYFVLTCGASAGGAGFKTQQLCEKMGLEYMGMETIVMPENYIMLFNAPDEEKSLRIIEDAEEQIDECVRLVKDGDWFYLGHGGPAGVLLTGLVNKTFYGKIISADKFRATDACTGCGTCAAVCPMNNIAITSYDRPVWGHSCTHCCACISSCPTGAIQYGKATEGKRRYTCPKKEV